MSKKLLHTPDGVRDIYGIECEKKSILQNKLLKRIGMYGYHNIETPTFEYFDVFSKEVGTIASRELFKFFDRDGNTLVLRPDFTPSIARSAAKYYMDETEPIRMCYIGNTFINNLNYQGRLKENTQLGAELLGDDSIDADAEMIAMIIELLKDAGLKEFQVSIGQIDFFKGLLEKSGISEEQEYELRELISNKNHFGIDEILDPLPIAEECKIAFSRIPFLFGDIDMLSEAKKYAFNKTSVSALERLEQLYDVLIAYGLADYVSFDLGLVSKYKYYTGIIFQAYTYGTGEAIVKGGRYDNLLSQFGKDYAAIGFAVVIDRLMNALNRQHIDIPVENNGSLLLYKEEYLHQAIQLSTYYRSQNIRIEMRKRKEEKEDSFYMTFAKNKGYHSVLLLESPENLKEIVLVPEQKNTYNIKDILCTKEESL